MNTEGTIQKVANPRFYRKSEAKLARLQQALDRKQKGSANREKARLKIARQHEHVAAQRKDYIYKLVSWLVSENQTIITETLAVQNMAKNHRLAKSIMDAGWGMLWQHLSNKCYETGRDHIPLDRWFPSSKTCSNCGVVNDALTLKDRFWKCEHCETVHDRDVNATVNLLIVGLQELAAGRAESINASLIGGTTLLEPALNELISK